MNDDRWTYTTERLLVKEWHSFSPGECGEQDLPVAVQGILTPRVTHGLPDLWQGIYTRERTASWIAERDKEGVTLLGIDSASGEPVGIIVLFETAAEQPPGSDLRLGYMMAEAYWGKGFATELVQGFVDWCRGNAIRSVSGGVDRDNPASIRVLEKCGFVLAPGDTGAGEQEYVLLLA